MQFARARSIADPQRSRRAACGARRRPDRPGHLEYRGPHQHARRRPQTCRGPPPGDLSRLTMTIGRILLVDHSRGALLFQETILRRRDTIVMTSLSGSDGLEKARAEQPQLIVFGFDLFDMT